ncbi:hypothetical protein HUJ04_009246 [Dendroctonus ponderosae]|nr:hypothetical protein HUJ04_009246 [Dendroctonus ponderosae]
MTNLLTKLKEKELFNGCRQSLSTLLKEIGFKWKKDDPRRGLMEVHNVAFKMVQSYREERAEGLYQFAFTDETWIFQNGTIGRSWQNGNVKSVKTIKRISYFMLATKAALLMVQKPYFRQKPN